MCFRSTTNGSPRITLGLWSLCGGTYGNEACASWDNCFLAFSTSACAKMYASRAFMMIDLVLSIVGFLYLIVVLIFLIIRKEHGESPAAIFLCFHLLTFLAGIIGFPIGISFALNINGSSVGVAAILAIVAVILDLVSVILLCVGVAYSDGKTPNSDQNSSGKVEVVGDDPSAHYDSTTDNVTIF
jgi:hypothetical protein